MGILGNIWYPRGWDFGREGLWGASSLLVALFFARMYHMKPCMITLFRFPKIIVEVSWPSSLRVVRWFGGGSEPPTILLNQKQKQTKKFRPLYRSWKYSFSVLYFHFLINILFWFFWSFSKPWNLFFDAQILFTSWFHKFNEMVWKFSLTKINGLLHFL